MTKKTTETPHVSLKASDEPVIPLRRVTADDIAKLLPDRSHRLTDNLVDKVNDLLEASPEIAESILNDFYTYQNVLLNNRVSVLDYINAVFFASFYMSGYDRKEAYKRTFPSRMRAMRVANKTDTQISRTISAYFNNKMVQDILTQASIPAHVAYRGVFHEAVSKARKLLNCGNLMVEQKATDTLIKHLMPPVASTLEIDINHKTDGTVNALYEALQALSEKESKLVAQGALSLTDVSERPLVVTGEVVKDD